MKRRREAEKKQRVTRAQFARAPGRASPEPEVPWRGGAQPRNSLVDPLVERHARHGQDARRTGCSLWQARCTRARQPRTTQRQEKGGTEDVVPPRPPPCPPPCPLPLPMAKEQCALLARFRTFTPGQLRCSGRNTRVRLSGTCARADPQPHAWPWTPPQTLAPAHAHAHVHAHAHAHPRCARSRVPPCREGGGADDASLRRRGRRIPPRSAMQYAQPSGQPHAPRASAVAPAGRCVSARPLGSRQQRLVDQPNQPRGHGTQSHGPVTPLFRLANSAQGP